MNTCSGMQWMTRLGSMVACAAAAVIALVPGSGVAQECGSFTAWFGTGCTDGMNTCCTSQTFFCGSDEPAGEVFCDASVSGPPGPLCGNISSCPSGTFGDCVPSEYQCAGDEVDCNGLQGDGCFPGPNEPDPNPIPEAPPDAPSPLPLDPPPAEPPLPKPPSGCGIPKVGAAGKDPIMLAVKAAATTPFTDFSVDRVSHLSIVRTYNSADVDLNTLGAGGVFGNGWRHNWDATLSCSAAGVCTVNRGHYAGYKFHAMAALPSLDGTETWQVYSAHAPRGYEPTHRNVLVQRPDGEWIVFLTDGRTLHFENVCTSCEAGTAYCTPALSGGKARLTKAVDKMGNSVRVVYDAPSGLLLGLVDDLGHSLEVRNPGSCQNYATELRYDGAVVARYSVTGSLLRSAVDADGNTLQSYVYVSAGAYWPRLQAVLDEAGTAIAEFSYDAYGKAIGLVDDGSSVAVTYGDRSAVVTEYFRGRFGDTAAASERRFDWNRRVVSISDGCACGSPKLMDWTKSGKLACSRDANGRVTSQEFDALGRVTRRVEFTGDACEVPASLPPDSREEWRAYGVARPIAQGLNLELDTVTAISRKSALDPTRFASEIFDYEQASQPTDPAGYWCAATALPAGSVLCRHITAGYVTGTSGPVLERHATFFSYDARGRLVRAYGPVNLDQPGANDIPPLEERTYWGDSDTPERRGRLQQVRRYRSPIAQPLVTLYDYDMFGLSRITAPDQTQRMIVKDGRGRSRFFVTADATGTVRSRSETRYYDGATPRLRILPSGSAERYSFDGKGRLRLTEYLSSDPDAPGPTPSLGWSESHVYDLAGNRIHTERRDAAGDVTWQQDLAYDEAHRIVWESNPSVPTKGKSWSYDGSGFLSRTIDEEGRGTAFTPDGLNRVRKVTRTGLDAAGLPTSLDVATYAFAPGADWLATVTDGDGRATTYAYDDFGRVERVGSPTLSRGGGAWYQYDSRGNVLARGDNDVTITYAYDGLDRVLSVNAQNSRDGMSLSYTYTYDEDGFAGRLTSVTEPDRTIRYSYDWAGRLSAEVIAENGVSAPLTTSYAYDLDGMVQQLTYPTGLKVVFDRDPATRRAVAIRSTEGTVYASDVAWRPGGPIASLRFGNSRTLAQSFNGRYEPLEIQSGPVWLTYSPSPAGDIGAVANRSEEPSGACVHDSLRTFKYDLQDRMTAWSDSFRTGAGVCPAEGLGGLAVEFTYITGTDQLASQRLPPPESRALHAYAYDEQGNVSFIGQYDAAGTSIASAVCLRHDPLGRMVLVGATNARPPPGGTACLGDADVSSVLARFKYDARNRRVARQVGDTWTYVVSDAAGNPLSEVALVSGAWTRLRDYVWVGGRLLAQIEHAGASTHPYYAHLDHLGTPRALTNENGQMVWGSYQRPFGEVGEKTIPDPVSGQTVVTNLRLPGQYDERLLGGIGLQGPYYNWNRWYLPGVGRYLELDPLGLAGGLNGRGAPDWYNYALRNPNRYIDPRGDVAIAIPPIIWAAGAIVAAWETYVAVCTAAGNCPWNQPTCIGTPQDKPLDKAKKETCKLEPDLLQPPLPGPPGMPPFPAQCVYSCPSGRLYQMPAPMGGCPTHVTIPL